MAENRVTIDQATVFDNIGDRQVEFSGELDGELQEFAVQYDVLEALSGGPPVEGEAAALFQRHGSEVEQAAARALARFDGIGRTTISGNDLEQPAGAGLGE